MYHVLECKITQINAGKELQWQVTWTDSANYEMLNTGISFVLSVKFICHMLALCLFYCIHMLIMYKNIALHVYLCRTNGLTKLSQMNQ